MVTRARTCASLLCLGASLASCEQTKHARGPEPDPAYDRAWQALGDSPSEALRQLEQASFPASSQVVCLRGVALEALGRRNDALRSLEECKRLEPRNALARVGLGRIRASDGRVAEAREEWRASHQANPADLGPLLLLATSAPDEAAKSESLAALRAWAALPAASKAGFPREYWLTLTWLEGSAASGSLETRKREWKDSKIGSPVAAVYQVALARALKRPELALVLLQALSRLEGAPASLQRELVELALELKQLGVAREAVDRLPVYPQDYGNLLLNARVQIASSEGAKANATLDAALRLVPDAAESREVQLLIAAARELVKDLAGARETLQKLELQDPHDLPVQLELARLEAQTDQTAAAARLRKVAEGHASDVEAMSKIGSAQLASHDPSGAAITFASLLERDPGDAALALNLADALAASGKQREAAEAYEDAVALSSDKLKPLTGLIAYQLERGRGNDALTALSKYSNAETNRIPIAVLRAQTLAKLGRAKEATASLVALTLSSPTSPDAFLALGRWHALNGQVEPAEQAFRKTLALDPRSKRAREGLADLYVKLHSAERAAVEFEQLAAIDGDAIWLNNAASLFTDVPGKIGKAVELAEQAHAAAPNRPEVVDTLGWALLRRGNAEDAERAGDLLQQAHQALSTPETAFHFGFSLTRRGKAEEGRALIADALKRGPKNAAWRADAEALR